MVRAGQLALKGRRGGQFIQKKSKFYNRFCTGSGGPGSVCAMKFHICEIQRKNIRSTLRLTIHKTKIFIIIPSVSGTVATRLVNKSLLALHCILNSNKCTPTPKFLHGDKLCQIFRLRPLVRISFIIINK